MAEANEVADGALEQAVRLVIEAITSAEILKVGSWRTWPLLIPRLLPGSLAAARRHGYRM